jgi:transcriptional regulator with XRE-family HTH domain
MILADKLKDYRVQGGFLQDDIAKEIGVSRSTYSNYEKGVTEPKAGELKALAELYNTTADELLSGEQAGGFDIGALNSEFVQITPEFDPRKFEEVLLYLTAKVGALPNVGETVLYKLLYFIDTDYYEQFGRSITGLSYVKQKFGPTPKQNQFRKVVESMTKADEIEIAQSDYFKHKQKKYLPHRMANLEVLSGAEVKHIDKEIERLAGKNAHELSELSHQDTPWLATKLGKEIDYQLVMYRTAATQTREIVDEL